MHRPRRRQQNVAALILGLAACVLVAAGCAEVQIESTLPAVPSATEAVVALPIADVSARARAALLEVDALDRIFGVERHTMDGYAFSLAVYGSEQAVIAPATLGRPENRYDLQVEALAGSLWLSPVYHRGSRWLPYDAAFHVHLEAIDDEHTRISVRALHPQVITGRSLSFGTCGLGRHNNYRDVAATTIEEGLVLRYLVTELGQ